MFCKKCGCSLEERVSFCPNCGEKIQSTSPPSDNLSAPGTASSSYPIASPTEAISAASAAPDSGSKVPASPYTYNNVKKQNRPGIKRHGLIKALVFLLIAAILVQLFAYPFLVQRISFDKLSTVAVKTVDPEKYDNKGVTDSETRNIVSYAKGLTRALSWQLKGHEKKVFDIASKYLKDPPMKGKGLALQASALPVMMLAGNSTGGTFTGEEIASDISAIATLLLQRGYTKLAVSLSALAAENSPVDPLIINNLSCALRADGLKEDAYRLLNYAWRLSPDCPEILTNMGNVCLDQGDTAQAGTWFDMALAIDEDFGLAREGLMLCYMNDERYEVAMRHMIKASETTFTPAVYKTYEKLTRLDNYEDIRDNVLSGFEFPDIAKTYQRTRDQSREGVDTPAGQLKIPQFPVFTGVEAFIGNLTRMNDYAMSIFTPAMDSLKGVAELAKQADEMIKSFQANGISGAIGAAKSMGLLGQGDSSTAAMDDGKMQLSMDYSRELYTVGLLGDYLDMKVKKPMDQMNEKMVKSGDPLLEAADRSMREVENRGESEQAWLSAMANNWGNSMSLNSGTVSANKASLNQHIDAFYQAVLPTYNEIKPLLEEYWLYCGGVIKYAGNDTVYKSLESQRKMKTYGNLGIFAIYAEFEVINVPITYEMYAMQGAAPEKPKEQPVEKLEEPEDEVPMPEETFDVDLGVVEVEWSDGELEVEVTALVAASVKYNHQQGTVTLAGGVGASTGDFIPMLGGKVTATYYVVISKSGVNDHGLATKTEYSVGEGVKYKVKETSTISSVTSAMDTTVEKAIVGGKIITGGFKRTTSEND